MFLSKREEKRQWVASGTERLREMKLIRLISETENSQRRDKWGEEAGYANEQMKGANRVYGGKFEAGDSEKWAVENMWDCNTVRGWCQNFFWGCSQRGPHTEGPAKTFITHSLTPTTRRFSQPSLLLTHAPAWLAGFVPHVATGNRRVKPTGSKGTDGGGGEE